MSTRRRAVLPAEGDEWVEELLSGRFPSAAEAQSAARRQGHRPATHYTAAFLAASAPSEQAAQLAEPFGATNLVPVQVVAAVSNGTLGTADTTWLATLRHDHRLAEHPVRGKGRSANGPTGRPARPVCVGCLDSKRPTGGRLFVDFRIHPVEGGKGAI